MMEEIEIQQTKSTGRIYILHKSFYVNIDEEELSYIVSTAPSIEIHNTAYNVIYKVKLDFRLKKFIESLFENVYGYKPF